jgi:hypothetical protein
MRDTIDMAREAGFEFFGKELTWESVICTEELKAFEALVRADEREVIEDRVKTLEEPMSVRLNVINKAIRERSANERARGEASKRGEAK